MRTSLLKMVAKLLFLPLLILSVALLVQGYSSTGGGFAAGALAGLAVLLQRIVFGQEVAQHLMSPRWRKLALGGGLAITLTFAVSGVIAGDAFLTHYPKPGEHVRHLGALELHTSLIFDIGVYLLVLAFVLEGVALVAPQQRTD